MTGIDVSEHNGTLDWVKINAAGIRFAIIRTGYGTSHTDNQFYANMKGAIANGLHIGIYHFSYALDAAGAKSEAKFVLKLIEQYKQYIDMHVFFDFEYDTVSYAKKQGVTLGRDAFNNHTVAFCETIQDAGYTAGTYYNLSYLKNYVDASKIGGYVKWFAQYNSAPGTTDYAIWQYSSDYKISGIGCRFDVNTLKDESIIKSSSKNYTIGWHKDTTGWWYADSKTSYYKNQWAKIDGKWYAFNQEGYMMANQWMVDSTGTYYLGDNGAMVTNMDVEIGVDGKLVPVAKAKRYYYLSDVPSYYRKELDPLITSGSFKGKGGEGDNLIVDMSEDALRVVIIAARMHSA